MRRTSRATGSKTGNVTMGSRIAAVTTGANAAGIEERAPLTARCRIRQQFQIKAGTDHAETRLGGQHDLLALRRER